MDDKTKQRYDDNIKHARDPKPGDYWHEMFTPVCVVLQRLGPYVIICKTRKSVDKDHWQWDFDKLEMIRIDEFDSYLSYKSNVPSLKDKYWCDVVPESMLKEVEYFKELSTV